MKVPQANKTRFDDRIYVTSKTKLHIKQNTQIVSNICRGDNYPGYWQEMSHWAICICLWYQKLWILFYQGLALVYFQNPDMYIVQTGLEAVERL